MGKAVADSEAMRNFAKQVKNYVAQQEALLQKLKGQYNAVGSQWKDMQYSKFGQSLAELEKYVKKQGPAFQEYAKRLEVKAKQVDDYLR